MAVAVDTVAGVGWRTLAGVLGSPGAGSSRPDAGTVVGLIPTGVLLEAANAVVAERGVAAAGVVAALGNGVATVAASAPMEPAGALDGAVLISSGGGTGVAVAAAGSLVATSDGRAVA